MSIGFVECFSAFIVVFSLVLIGVSIREILKTRAKLKKLRELNDELDQTLTDLKEDLKKHNGELPDDLKKKYTEVLSGYTERYEKLE